MRLTLLVLRYPYDVAFLQEVAKTLTQSHPVVQACYPPAPISYALTSTRRPGAEEIPPTGRRRLGRQTMEVSPVVHCLQSSAAAFSGSLTTADDVVRRSTEEANARNTARDSTPLASRPSDVSRRDAKLPSSGRLPS